MPEVKIYLFDTNVLIDYCDASRPEHETARALVKAIEEHEETEKIALISSLKDTYYVLCKVMRSEEVARKIVKLISSEVFEVVDLKAIYGTLALASNEPDFEDGLVRAAAESLQVKAIVSRDASAFSASRIPKLSPAQALSEIAA